MDFLVSITHYAILPLIYKNLLPELDCHVSGIHKFNSNFGGRSTLLNMEDWLILKFGFAVFTGKKVSNNPFLKLHLFTKLNILK